MTLTARLVLASSLLLCACHSNDDSDQQNTPPADTNAPAQAMPAPASTNADAAPAGKPIISKLDDLPRYTYPISGSAVELVTSDEKFAALATQVRADTEKDLNDYTITDKTTIKGLKGTLLTLDLLEGKDADARKLIGELKDLEDKPALKLISGLTVLTRFDVQDKLKLSGLDGLNKPEFQQAFEKELAQRTDALPWPVVGAELKSMKAGFQIVSRNLVMGQIQSEIDPAVAKTHSLSYDLAGRIIHLRSSLQISIPLKEPIVAALTQVVNAHRVAKANIWPSREVTFASDEKLTPVVVGIWDSGVDPAVYPKLLFNDPDYPKDGDDAHGLAFDLHSNHIHGALYPLGANAGRFPELRAQIKGLEDLQSAIDSPEATELQKKMGALSADKVKPFLEDLEIFGNFAHGTHVAGIATKGNPFARILIARITFDYHLIPENPTIEQAKKDSLASQQTVDYFKAHNVRVVNMSWGGSLKDVDDALEKNGMSDATKRKELARQIFDIGKDGLFNAIKSAPGILFVTAAGNSDNDVNFDEVIPSSFDLPNMMTIGAVDQAGDETSFTSFGKNVAAYADGFEVDSPVPGGTHLKFSGTSMASPQVANLAAKLFALDPKLTPTDVIGLVKAGLDSNPNDPRIKLINPKKSVEALHKQS